MYLLIVKIITINQLYFWARILKSNKPIPSLSRPKTRPCVFHNTALSRIDFASLYEYDAGNRLFALLGKESRRILDRRGNP